MREAILLEVTHSRDEPANGSSARFAATIVNGLVQDIPGAQSDRSGAPTKTWNKEPLKNGGDELLNHDRRTGLL